MNPLGFSKQCTPPWWDMLLTTTRSLIGGILIWPKNLPGECISTARNTGHSIFCTFPVKKDDHGMSLPFSEPHLSLMLSLSATS